MNETLLLILEIWIAAKEEEKKSKLLLLLIKTEGILKMGKLSEVLRKYN